MNSLRLVPVEQEGASFKRATLSSIEQFDLLLDIETSKKHDLVAESVVYDNHEKCLLNLGKDRDIHELVHVDQKVVDIESEGMMHGLTNYLISNYRHQSYSDIIVPSGLAESNVGKVVTSKMAREYVSADKSAVARNKFSDIYMSFFSDKDGAVILRIRNYKEKLNSFVDDLILSVKEKFKISKVRLKNIFLNGKFHF